MSWYERVADDDLPTLQAIAQAYRDGQFGRSQRAAAEAISTVLKARKIADIGRNGVCAWLATL